MFNKILFNKNPFNKIIGSGLERISFIGDPTDISISLLIYTPFSYDSSLDNIEFDTDLTLYFPVETEFQQDSQGSLECIIATYYPIEDIEFSGDGSIEISTIGVVVLSIFTLRDISLPPGQSIEIDTDSMTILFKQNNEYDVSSVTPNSIFFELGPDGENQLKFAAEYLPKLVGGEKILPPNGANDLKVVTIWSERWL